MADDAKKKNKNEQNEQTSIWKKEISFGRKKQPKEPKPKKRDEQAAPVVEQPAAVELVNAYVPHEAPGTAAERFGPLLSSDEPAVEQKSETVEEPIETAPEPVFEVFSANDPQAEVVELTPPETPTPAELAPASVEATQTLPAPAAPAPEPEPVVVHPPVPAAQLPPLPEEPAEKKRERKEKPAKAEKPKRERRSMSLPRPQPRAARAGKLPKRLVGLKVGASQIAAATVANNGHAEVLQLAREALDPGIVTAGELREPEALADALREFFKKHKLPKRGVRLGIATNRIGVRTLEIGGIDDPKQLANAIKFRAQEALPIPIDEAVLDYQVLDESTNEQGERTRKILLVLAYRDLIDRYVGACRKAGITLAGIDLEAFALLRALAAPPEDAAPAQAALVAVTIGHDRTTFAVSDGRVCEFTRVLDWGGSKLNVTLARVLNRAPSEVDHFKHALTLDGVEVPEGLTPEQTQSAREAMRKEVQSFARELVSSLQFYQNQPGSLGIGEIVLTGGTAHLSGLADELQRLIGVRVRVGDPLVRVKLGKRFKEPEQLGSLTVAIGLGIED